MLFLRYFGMNTTRDICIPILCALDCLCCVSLSLLLVEPERFTIWRLSFDSRKCQTLRVPPAELGVYLRLISHPFVAPTRLTSRASCDVEETNVLTRLSLP